MNLLDTLKQAREALEYTDSYWHGQADLDLLGPAITNLTAAIEMLQGQKLVAFPDREEFERQAKYQGITDFSLNQNGLRTYANDIAEMAWRVWANKKNPAPAIPEGEQTCSWYEGDDGGPWATQCNELFNIENEGPEANEMKFCCFCGKKLVEVAAEIEDEEDE